MIVRRSALVDRSDAHLFDLIEAAEHYPVFLPWCAGARIVARDNTMVSADLQVRYRGLSFDMRTRNPKQRPEWMTIHLEHGPFRRFDGQWRLRPLGDAACRVDFALDYEFDSAWMTRVASPVFDHIANTLVDAFVRRAESLPPSPSPEPG
jgi:ribosome-associated toxin RatA of RatAB toxin-antitoxin module